MSRKIINKTVCVVEENKSTGLKRWIIRKHPDSEMIGLPTMCGVPVAKDLPIGTKNISYLEIPVK